MFEKLALVNYGKRRESFWSKYGQEAAFVQWFELGAMNEIDFGTSVTGGNLDGIGTVPWEMQVVRLMFLGFLICSKVFSICKRSILRQLMQLLIQAIQFQKELFITH